MFGDCSETVSILYAVIFGADGACVAINTFSILTAFGAFMVLIVIAQFFARLLWKTLTQPGAPMKAEDATPPKQTPYRDDPKYRDSAIRSSKR